MYQNLLLKILLIESLNFADWRVDRGLLFLFLIASCSSFSHLFYFKPLVVPVRENEFNFTLQSHALLKVVTCSVCWFYIHCLRWSCRQMLSDKSSDNKKHIPAAQLILLRIHNFYQSWVEIYLLHDIEVFAHTIFPQTVASTFALLFPLTEFRRHDLNAAFFYGKFAHIIRSPTWYDRRMGIKSKRHFMRSMPSTILQIATRPNTGLKHICNR